MIKKLALVGVLTVGLAACNTTAGEKQTIGGLLGGIGGAVAGSQIGGGSGKVVAIAAGTLIGAFLGSEVGASLDRADRLAMERTTTGALETQPTGSTSSWRNPDSGNSGTVTPTRTYGTGTGAPCREFTQTVTIGGQTEEAYGTACRQADGSWKIRN